jgi:hypothetical protein
MRSSLVVAASGLRASQWAHFGALLERVAEGEESCDSDDVLLAVRAQMGNGKAVARDEDDDDDEDEDDIDDVGEGNQEL